MTALTMFMKPAHPRSRGEHTARFDAFDVTVGSSPLARGTPGFFGEAVINLRLIPARAGNTP